MSNLKKYDFSFNLSGLQEYTEQRTSTLISETILTGDFAQLVTVIPNVKGTQELYKMIQELKDEIIELTQRIEILENP